MKSSSIRLVPGSLWRLLAFEKHGKVITMLDGDLMERVPEFIARTEAMANANLDVWRPFRHARGRPVRQLLDAFTWNCRSGRVQTSVNLTGGGHSMIEQAHWPDYGFEEWFLTAVIYPRMAGSGVLTFLQPTDQSVLLTLDIEYVTRANSNSEIFYYGDPVR